MRILLFLLLALLGSCGKDTSYVHLNREYYPIYKSENHRVVGDTGVVDIIWVIDNSLSMKGIQDTIIANAQVFMEEFTKYKELDWKMGLLSTSENESSYLGFDVPFGAKDPDPVGRFQARVRSLGLNGSGIEKSFTPVMQKLTSHPNFLRPRAHLIVIFVTDEKEQSLVSAPDFLANLVARKAGNSKLVKAYGAFETRDFNCKYGQFVYAGSPFEEIINLTKGKVFSTCVPDFGKQMASMGQDIISTISSPVIMLKQRPLAGSLRVYYKGEELLPGSVSEGGLWFYDPEINGVRFHSLEFVDYNFKEVSIDFEVDQGVGDS